MIFRLWGRRKNFVEDPGKWAKKSERKEERKKDSFSQALNRTKGEEDDFLCHLISSLFLSLFLLLGLLFYLFGSFCSKRVSQLGSSSWQIHLKGSERTWKRVFSVKGRKRKDFLLQVEVFFTLSKCSAWIHSLTVHSCCWGSTTCNRQPF